MQEALQRLASIPGPRWWSLLDIRAGQEYEHELAENIARATMTKPMTATAAGATTTTTSFSSFSSILIVIITTTVTIAHCVGCRRSVDATSAQ